MTSYVEKERDFILRTLHIIDQYDEIVRPQVEQEFEYEVTLLMNCLLGLLVYPQQIATRREYQKHFDAWLTREKLVNVGREWAINPEFVQSAGFRYKGDEEIPITVEQLTLRNLVRQMRNTAVHARFDVDHNNGQISTIEFKDDSREDGFAIKIPTDNLGKFVRKLAESARDRIPEDSMQVGPRGGLIEE